MYIHNNIYLTFILSVSRTLLIYIVQRVTTSIPLPASHNFTNKRHVRKRVSRRCFPYSLATAIIIKTTVDYDFIYIHIIVHRYNKFSVDYTTRQRTDFDTRQRANSLQFNIYFIMINSYAYRGYLFPPLVELANFRAIQSSAVTTLFHNCSLSYRNT